MKGVYNTTVHNGTKRWYKDGFLHREDGPAIEWSDGDKYWYTNNLLHREDGPAIECVNTCDNQYYLEGIYTSKAEFDSRISKKNNMKYSKDNPPTEPGTYDLGDGISIYISAYENGHTFTLWQRNSKTHRDNGPAIIDHWGNKEYWIDGKRHRVDGPAIENVSGDNEYYVNGVAHRLDGPALDYVSGHKTWYKEGKIHREDGPACYGPNSKNEWYLEDKKVSKKKVDALIASKKSEVEKYMIFTEDKIKAMNEHCAKVLDAHIKPLPYSETNLPTEIGNYNLGNGVWYEVTENYIAWKNNESEGFHKLDGPAVVYHDGKKRWYKDGLRHREDGPAIDDPDNKSWYMNGLSHREGGPAIEDLCNQKYWWYKDGFLHRADGPAVEYPDGTKWYYLNGVRLSEEDFNRINDIAYYHDGKKYYSKTKVVLKKKETNMSNKSFGEKFKEAQLEGAKRNVVRTGTDATMNGMRLALLATGLAGPTTDSVNAFMSTKLAAGLTKTAVGLGLDHVPQLKSKPLTKVFSREFRIQGMEDMQQVFLDEFMKNLIPAIAAEFKKMEKNSSIRVSTDQEEAKEEAEPLEEEEFVDPVAVKAS